MNNGKFKLCLLNSITLLKEQAFEAKKEADNAKNGLKDYAKGVLMGYYSIITLLKHQAFVFCIDQKELGLADIKPDADLLGMDRSADVDFGKDNWEIDVLNEEKVKGYLYDTIQLLLDQALEAKKDADNPEEGYENYSKGEALAYYKVISTLKNHTSLFNLKEEEVSLSNIDPEAYSA